MFPGVLPVARGVRLFISPASSLGRGVFPAGCMSGVKSSIPAKQPSHLILSAGLRNCSFPVPAGLDWQWSSQVTRTILHPYLAESLSTVSSNYSV